MEALLHLAQNANTEAIVCVSRERMGDVGGTHNFKVATVMGAPKLDLLAC